MRLSLLRRSSFVMEEVFEVSVVDEEDDDDDECQEVLIQLPSPDAAEALMTSADCMVEKMTQEGDEAVSYSPNDEVGADKVISDESQSSKVGGEHICCKHCGSSSEAEKKMEPSASEEINVVDFDDEEEDSNGARETPEDDGKVVSKTVDGEPDVSDQRLTKMSQSGNSLHQKTERISDRIAPLTTINEETISQSKRLIPKWQIREGGASSRDNAGSKKKYNGTVEPWCAKKRMATLLTGEGPIDVHIVRNKAVKCSYGRDKYRCPVPNCSFGDRIGSRVFIAKHFNNAHKDFRSWRDVFVAKDAPQFILRDEDEDDDNDNEVGIHEEDETPASTPVPSVSSAITTTTEPSWTQANRPPLCSTLKAPEYVRTSAFAPPVNQKVLSPLDLLSNAVDSSQSSSLTPVSFQQVMTQVSSLHPLAPASLPQLANPVSSPPVMTPVSFPRTETQMSLLPPTSLTLPGTAMPLRPVPCAHPAFPHTLVPVSTIPSQPLLLPQPNVPVSLQQQFVQVSSPQSPHLSNAFVPNMMISGPFQVSGGLPQGSPILQVQNEHSSGCVPMALVPVQQIGNGQFVIQQGSDCLTAPMFHSFQSSPEPKVQKYKIVQMIVPSRNVVNFATQRPPQQQQQFQFVPMQMMQAQPSAGVLPSPSHLVPVAHMEGSPQMVAVDYGAFQQGADSIGNQMVFAGLGSPMSSVNFNVNQGLTYPQTSVQHNQNVPHPSSQMIYVPNTSMQSSAVLQVPTYQMQ